jgi:hypothetical protein
MPRVGIALNRAPSPSSQVRAAAGTADAVATQAGALGHLFERQPHEHAAAWGCEPESRIIVMEQLSRIGDCTQRQ